MASLTKQVIQFCKAGINVKVFKQFGILAVSTSFIFSNAIFAIQPIVDIAQTPLELTPTVAPNVMILLDDSGSMDFEVMTADANSSGLFFAPNPDGTNYGSSEANLTIKQRAGCELVTSAFGGYAYGVASSLNKYTPDASLGTEKSKCYVAHEEAWRFRCSSFNKLYYDPDVIYEPWPGLREDGTPFVDAPIEAAPLDPYLASSPTIDIEAPNESEAGIDAFRYYTCERDGSGNFFPVSVVTINESSPQLEKQNFANWFSYHRSRHLRAKALLGDFIVGQNNTRIGLTQLNQSVASVKVEEMNVSFEDDGAKRNLLNALYSSTPAQIASRFDSRYLQTARYLKCRNNNIFSDVGDIDDPDCPAEPAPAGTCQANHIILSSDGFLDDVSIFNEPGNGSRIGDEDTNPNNTSNKFDEGPFSDAPSVLPNSDYRTFSDLTITFYKRNLHPQLDNQFEPTTVDINRYFETPALEADDKIHQHIKTHVVLFDVPLRDTVVDQEIIAAADLLSFPGNVGFGWLNPVESDIGLLQGLYHAAYSGRGEVVRATDPIGDNNLNNGANTLTSAVAQGIGSTTPVAINTQGTNSGPVIYRTFYDSSSNSGDLVAQEIIINSQGQLNIEADNELNFLWSAAENLDVTLEDGVSNRNIISFSNQGINFEFDNLSGAQKTQLETPIPSSLPSDFPNIVEERIKYLKGDDDREGTSFDVGEFRIRPEVDSTGGGVVHNAKLGTIANSAPVFVGRPQGVGRFGGAWPSEDGKTYFDFQSSETILERDPSMLVGANDGMLHLFNADSGDEVYAYIPSLVYDNLSALTFPEYKHRFYVDGSPIVEDIFSTLEDKWKTVVIGGLGAGGRGYYALDITNNNPSVIDPADRVLWEFGLQDDPDYDSNYPEESDLGLSFGEPVIAMSNVDGGANKKWVAIFGNGYNSTSQNGDAVIYVLFIDQGIDGDWSTLTDDVIKINLGEGGNSRPNGIADIRAIDRNGDGTVDFLLAGDLLGNLHVVDISSSSVRDWDDDNYILFEAEYDGVNQPITTKPIVVNHEGGTSDDVIVIFATGSYFTNSDAIDTNIQSIYGLVHDFNPNNAPISRNGLTQQRLSNEQFTDPVTNETVDVRIISDEPNESPYTGWVIDFDVPKLGASQGSEPEFRGEKAIRGLQLRSGVLFVNTIIPQPLSCDPAPGGFSLAINPQTGTAGEEPIFDINNDNEFNDEDSIQLTSDGGYKVIVGTRFDSTPSDSTFFGDYRITQLSNTNIDAILTNTAKTELVGRQAWREVEF